MCIVNNVYRESIIKLNIDLTGCNKKVTGYSFCNQTILSEQFECGIPLKISEKTHMQEQTWTVYIFLFRYLSACILECYSLQIFRKYKPVLNKTSVSKPINNLWNQEK